MEGCRSKATQVPHLSSCPRGSRRGRGGFQGSGEQRTLGGGFLTVGEEERNWKLLQLLVLLTHFLGRRAHCFPFAWGEFDQLQLFGHSS